MARSSADVTRLLREWQGGDQGAFAKLVPLVYKAWLHRELDTDNNDP